MKKIIAMLLVVTLTFQPVYAWVPCMIFCDAGCGGAALTAFGVSINSAMQTQISANQDLLSVINDSTQSVVDLGTNLSDEWTSSNMDITSAMDARTNKIELAQSIGLKNREYTTDAENQSLVNAFKEKYIAEVVSTNNSMFSNQSMPESVEVGVLASGEIKKTYIKSHQLVRENATNQNIYADELSAGDLAFSVNARLSTGDDVYASAITICEHTLSNEEIKNMQALITYVTNPNPLPIIPDSQLFSSNAHSYELARRIYNSKTLYISSIANEIISGKAQFSNPDWVQSFVHRTSTEPHLSLNETFGSLINGRISSEGWNLDIKLLNETGLQRELTYLQAEENALLFMLSQKREWRNQLYSLLTIEEVGSQLRKLNRSVSL